MARGNMIYLTRLCVLLLVIVFAESVIFAQHEDDPAEEPISLSIAVEQSCFSADDDIVFTVTIRNNTAFPLYFYKPKTHEYLPGVRLVISDSRRLLVGGRNPISRPAFLKPRTDDFLRLDANSEMIEMVETRLRSRGVSEDGTYYVWVRYEIPVSQHVIPKDLADKPVVTLKYPEPVSKILAISVATTCSVNAEDR
jgi:hypothetical protein